MRRSAALRDLLFDTDSIRTHVPEIKGSANWQLFYELAILLSQSSPSDDVRCTALLNGSSGCAGRPGNRDRAGTPAAACSRRPLPPRLQSLAPPRGRLRLPPGNRSRRAHCPMRVPTVPTSFLLVTVIAASHERLHCEIHAAMHNRSLCNAIVARVLAEQCGKIEHRRSAGRSPDAAWPRRGARHTRCRRCHSGDSRPRRARSLQRRSPKKDDRRELLAAGIV
jgi:hypothetical protein